MINFLRHFVMFSNKNTLFFVLAQDLTIAKPSERKSDRQQPKSPVPTSSTSNKSKPNGRQNNRQQLNKQLNN